MAAYTELKMLKAEEAALVKIASKLSEQLNRLKVEELALLSQIRHQDQQGEKSESDSGVKSSQGPLSQDHLDDADKVNVTPLTLATLKTSAKPDETEEEEEDDESELNTSTEKDQLSMFVKHMEKA